jgi:pSer/pThr/pTyr-binding forkhead associated (FHA) protein
MCYAVHYTEMHSNALHSLNQSVGQGDLASRNATFVNGARIRVAVQLCPGDKITIGATLLEVTLEVTIE